MKKKTLTPPASLATVRQPAIATAEKEEGEKD